MQDAGIIRAYVDVLGSKLDFSPPLSRRVRQEIEDHLREAAVRGGNGRDSERRAVANFGDPHAIAAQFAAAWLVKQAHTVGFTVVLVIAGVFVAMKARVAWYGVAQWGLSEQAKTVAQVVGLVDACAFWVSVIMAIVGLACLVVRSPPPAALYAAHARRLRRVLIASTVSTAALIVSVIGDGLLTGLRLIGREDTVRLLVPLSSMIIEIGCAAVLVVVVRTVVGRMARATVLLEM